MHLNVDAGELPTEPDDLYRLAEMVNVACGGHAGDVASMERVVAIAMSAGTRIVAHPSYPDRAGFGRATLTISPEALEATVFEQVSALADVAARCGARVGGVKPHGALYHDANRDPALARAVARAARRVLGEGACIVGPAQGALSSAATDEGLALLREGFADRGVRADGSLVPRGEPGALVTDPARAAARARELAASGEVDTICVHGDTEGAIEIVRAVRAALEAMR